MYQLKRYNGSNLGELLNKEALLIIYNLYEDNKNVAVTIFLIQKILDSTLDYLQKVLSDSDNFLFDLRELELQLMKGVKTQKEYLDRLNAFVKGIMIKMIKSRNLNPKDFIYKYSIDALWK